MSNLTKNYIDLLNVLNLGHLLKLEEENSELKKTIELLGHEHDNLKDTYEQEVMELQDAVNHISKKKRSLKAECAKLQEANKLLEQKYNTAQDDVILLSEKNKSLKDEHDKLQSSVISLRNSNIQLEKECVKIKLECAELNKYVNELEETERNSKSQIQTLATQNSDFIVRVQDLKNTHANILFEYNKQDALISNYEHNLKLTKNTLVERNMRIIDQERAINELTELNMIRRSDIIQLLRELNIAEDQLLNANNDLDQLILQFNATKAESELDNALIIDLETQNENLQKHVDKMQKVINDLQLDYLQNITPTDRKRNEIKYYSNDVDLINLIMIRGVNPLPYLEYASTEILLITLQKLGYNFLYKK